MTDKTLTNIENLHIVFDLDGTLIDSVGGIHHAMNTALNDLGLEGFKQSYYRERIGGGAHKLTREICDLHEHIMLQDLYTLYQSHYERFIYYDTHIYNGINALLNDLRVLNIPLSVLTNKNHNFAQPMVQHFFPETKFLSVNGVKSDGLHKPDLEFIQRSNSGFLKPKKTTLFIGDTPSDIECAKVANGISVAVTWGYSTTELLESCQPDFLISNPMALLSIIERITQH